MTGALACELGLVDVLAEEGSALPAALARASLLTPRALPALAAAKRAFAASASPRSTARSGRSAKSDSPSSGTARSPRLSRPPPACPPPNRDRMNRFASRLVAAALAASASAALAGPPTPAASTPAAGPVKVAQPFKDVALWYGAFGGTICSWLEREPGCSDRHGFERRRREEPPGRDRPDHEEQAREVDRADASSRGLERRPRVFRPRTRRYS